MLYIEYINELFLNNHTSAMRILVFQNFDLTPLGVLDQCIQKRSGFVDTFYSFLDGSIPKDSTKFDGLIILGGPMSADDDEHYPKLRDMVNLIHQFDSQEKPILGICLGAQIIARAFGGKVYKSSKFELGFTPVFSEESLILDDKVLCKCPPILHTMQWHFDTFDLPKKATLLMYGEKCQNQAYRIGKNIYGFQFHLEVNREILQTWIDTRNDFIKINYPNFAQTLTQQMNQYIEESEEFCRNVGNAWLDLVEARMFTKKCLSE